MHPNPRIRSLFAETWAWALVPCRVSLGTHRVTYARAHHRPHWTHRPTTRCPTNEEFPPSFSGPVASESIREELSAEAVEAARYLPLPGSERACPCCASREAVAYSAARDAGAAAVG